MSDSSAASPSGPASPHVAAYLTRQLARNPIHESGDIVAERAKTFKLNADSKEPKPTAAPAATADLRKRVREKLEKIRIACFGVEVEKALVSLDRLQLQDFPDLAVLAGRLRVILNSRKALPRLKVDKRFDSDFFSCYKKILSSSPREVTVLREQVLASFRHRKNRKRGQAMIRLLKTELPELYALEQEWLDSLLKAQKYQTGEGSSGGERKTSNNFLAFLFAFLFGLPAIIRGCVPEDDNPRADTPFRGQTRLQMQSDEVAAGVEIVNARIREAANRVEQSDQGSNNYEQYLQRTRESPILESEFSLDLEPFGPPPSPKPYRSRYEPSRTDQP